MTRKYTEPEAFDKIREIISEHLGIRSSDISYDTYMIQDLGTDSLDRAELLMKISQAFCIDISDDMYDEWNVVGDIMKYIRQTYEFKAETNQRYNQCMDIFKKYPNVLPKIVKISDANIYKLREHIYNIFETRLPLEDLRSAQNSPDKLQQFIARKYAKKIRYKTKIQSK